MTDSEKPEDRIAVDDPRSHHTPTEQAAWVRWVAAGVIAQGVNTIRPDPNVVIVAEKLADELLVKLRERDRTFDGEG